MILAARRDRARIEWGFLPCLRRGEPVPAVKAAELIYALNQLEEELDGADVDRPPHGPCACTGWHSSRRSC